MFAYCSSLASVPEFDTSSVTNMESMFYKCSALTSVPLFDTSSVTNMSKMFYSCSSLTTIPLIDTSKVTSMQYMFGYCSSLTSIPLLDTSSVTEMYNMFYNCSKLTTVGGFKDLGKAFTSSTTISLWKSLPLSSESVTNIANTVYDMNQNTSIQSATISFPKTVYAALTDEQKATFAAKNWTVKSL